MSDDGFKKATAGDVVKLEIGDHIEGSFQGYEPSKQFPDSFAVRIKQGDDIKVVFVSKIVTDLIDSNGILSGQQIRIFFKGMKKNEAGTRE